MDAFAVLNSLLERLDANELAGTCVDRRWAPIPYFGDFAGSLVATVGINPSNLEFEDRFGRELKGRDRRFLTMTSLETARWSDSSDRHRQMIIESCDKHFDRNPNNKWFRPLNKVIAGTGVSYYCSDACHLDLVPYATTCKWSCLNQQQKSKLLRMNRDVVGQLLSISPIEVLLLNGKTVVEGFQRAASIRLECKRMDDWTLHQQSRDIQGFAYRGVIDSLSGNKLRHRVLVLGYNHSIPGNPVPHEVANSIRDWIGKEHNCWFARAHL